MKQQYPQLQHPNFVHKPMRSILEDVDPNASVVILREHGSNNRCVQFVRQSNVLVPIYIVSNSLSVLPGANGNLAPNTLNYDTVLACLTNYPQQHVWDMVFDMDHTNRQGIRSSIN